MLPHRLKIVFFLVALTTQVQARERLALNNNIHQNYISPRAMGMGNAFTAMADDYNVLYYNPGGLAFLKKGDLNIKLEASGTPGMMSFYNDLNTAKNKPEPENIPAITAVFEQYYGSEYNFRPVLGGTRVWPGSGLGIIPMDLSLDLGIHRNLGPTLSVEGYQDSTIAYGKGTLIDYDKADNGDLGEFGVGVTGKLVYREYVGKALPAPEFAINPEYFSAKDADEGMATDIDVGLLWELPSKEYVYFQPYLSAVVRNVIDYGFKTNMHLVDANTGEPPKLGRRLDLGSRLQGKKFWNLIPSFNLDIKDIGHDYWTWMKGLHVGAEVLWDISWWLRGGYRIGLNQGYFTAGVSFTFVWFQMDIATWGEEMGTTNALKQNRRWALSLSLDF